jgi:type I restriction enzyme S subunit
MNEWVAHRIDQAAEILDNFRVPVSEEVRDRNPGDTPYYGANGLQGFINGYLFNEPLILIAEDGGYFDEYASRPVAYRIEGKSWVNNHAHILRPTKHMAFDFLFYSLQHKNITPFIKGGTRAKLNQKELREIEILVPSDTLIQKEIGRILQTIDQAIEHTSTLIEKYQQIKAGLMHDLFTRGIGADGKLRPPREQAPELYQQTPIGWIPKDWGLDILDRQIRIIDCKHVTPKYQSSGFPIVRPRNVSDEGLDLINVDYVSLKDYKELTDVHAPTSGDIVYSRNASFGIPCYIETDEKFAIGQDVVIMTEAKVESRFIFYLLKSHLIWQQISRLFAGSTFSRINLGDIRRYVVPVLPTDEQVAVADSLLNADRSINSEIKEQQKLAKLKTGLMHDLLTGKVQVTPNTATKEAIDVQN